MKIACWFFGLLFLGWNALASADVLSGIRTSGVIRLGYLENSPPFSFREGGEARGYSVGLCEKVVERMRVDIGLDRLRIEWVPVTLRNRFDMLEQGRIHIECGISTWTLSRQKRVDFSLMTFVDGGSVLVRNETDLFKLEDFQGKRIALVMGTTTEQSLADELARRGVQVEVVPVETAEAGAAALNSGQVEGYASDRLVLIGLALNSPTTGMYRVVDEDFSLEPYALGLPRNEADFRLAVNRGLAHVYRSGEINGIYDRWIGHLGRPGVLLNALYYLQRIPE